MSEMYVILCCIPHVKPIIRNLSKATLVEFHNVYVDLSSTDRAYEKDVMWDLMDEDEFQMTYVADGFPSIEALLDLGSILGVNIAIYKDGQAQAHVSINPYASKRARFTHPDVPVEHLGRFTAALLASWSTLAETAQQN